MHAPLYRPYEDQNRWNFFFSLFFILVLALSVWGVEAIRGSFPHTLPALDALLMALASMRITRLVVYDKITRFFREWFVDCRVIKRGKEEWVELTPVARGMRATMHDLLTCPWCIGMWSALIVSFCYFAFPWAWYVILFLAIAGAGSLFQLFANWLGWAAENRKLDAQARQ